MVCVEKHHKEKDGKREKGKRIAVPSAKHRGLKSTVASLADMASTLSTRYDH